MKTKDVTQIAMLAATCIALRFAFSYLPNIQPITAIFLLIAFFSTRTKAILAMAITMIVTALYLGMGPWVIEQLVSYALIIFFVPFFRKLPAIYFYLYGFLAGIIYGLLTSVMDYFVYDLKNFWTYFVTGLPFNLAHAFSNFVFLLIFLPLLKKFISKNRIY
jgi:hypothetical protein